MEATHERYSQVPNLPKSLDGRAGAGLPSIIQRWPGRNSHENSAGPVPELDYRRSGVCHQTAAGMAMFNPIMLSMAIGIAFHNIVGTAAWAKQGVTFSLRRLLGIVILPFGSQLTSSRLVTYADDKDVAYAIACVFGSAAMLADPIATMPRRGLSRDDISLDRIGRDRPGN